MSLAFLEHAARLFEPPAPPRWPTPAEMAAELDPKFVRTPALDVINAAITEALTTPDARLIISMPPQEGKSTLATKWAPVWLLRERPDTRIVIASYAANVARRMGRLIRGEIGTHGDDLGITVADDVAAQHEFQIADHVGGVYAVGIGGGLTSRPADVMIIDDPLKDRAEADSQVFRDRAWDWWTDVASTRLAPGAPVILILTRWHHDDLAGRLLTAEDGHLWKVINIPAQADHRPENGETDILGRQPGEYMISARGRTPAQWERRKIQSGTRTWTSLFQGRPSPDEGGLFDRKRWVRYDVPQHVEQPNGIRLVPNIDLDTELVASWDLAFKGTSGSDYVVGQVWLRRGAHVFLLEQVRGRWSFTETLDQIRTLSARWPQAVAKYVEDKANGPAVLDALQRTVHGLIPVNPEGGKEARANAVAPLVEAGNVHLPAAELAPWVADLIEEAAAFPHGAHDDQVDAMTQALNRLLIKIDHNPKTTTGITTLH